jgi:hypothetical protein
VPGNISAPKAQLRPVSVDAVLPSGQKLKVRTRRAYLIGDTAGETSFNAQ